MAPGNREDEDVVAWAREVRAQEQLQADASALEEVRSFLGSKEAESVREATHTLLENFPDWWTRNRRAPPGLQIESQEDLEELYRHAGFLFGLGIPLTLAERRTTAFRFFQDVEAWGSRDFAVPFEELIGPDTELMQRVGGLVGETFSAHGGFLDAAVYDASGMSQTRGVRKTSVRLVWPGIVVDSDRAARVRDLLVHRLSAAAAEGGSPVAELEARLLKASSANAWHSVFGDAAYAGRSSVRMPLSDRVSPLPLRAPEKRPLVPVGVLRFTFGGQDKLKVEWLCRQPDLDDAEWIKIGCLRQGPDVQLTEWSVPSWPGSQPVAPSAGRGARVKVRTAGGSDGGGGLRLRSTNRAPPPERAGQLLALERRVCGAVDQFCDKMEQHLGKATVEADGAYVWKQQTGDARIVMYAEDKRVKVIGRPNQVRSLVVIVAPYTEAQPGLGQAGQPGQAGQAGWSQQLDGGGRMPSAAFAPDTVEDQNFAAHQLESPGSSDQSSSSSQGRQLRQATQPFIAEGQGELGLEQDEVVCVTHDPEGEQSGSADRWVYGRNEATGACGWFPLSHTSPLEETA